VVNVNETITFINVYLKMLTRPKETGAGFLLQQDNNILITALTALTAVFTAFFFVAGWSGFNVMNRGGKVYH
jgi:Mg2+ and Co2+ transporter CorA